MRILWRPASHHLIVINVGRVDEIAAAVVVVSLCLLLSSGPAVEGGGGGAPGGVVGVVEAVALEATVEVTR